MKQQKKFSDHSVPARRPRKTQGKCVLFADAAKLYIEYSKAVTSAETAVKRMRFFAQFYNAAFAERDIASISPSDVYRWFDGVITAKRRDGKGCYAPRTLRSVWGQLCTFFSWCSTRYPVQNPMYAIKMPRTRAAECNMTFRHITLPCTRRTVFMYIRLINAHFFIQRYLTAAAMLSMFVSQMHVS